MMINLTKIVNISCRGAIDNAITFHVGGPGCDSRRPVESFVLSFVFFLFLFSLTDLKYTGRRIADLVSKIQ